VHRRHGAFHKQAMWLGNTRTKLSYDKVAIIFL